MMTGGKPRLQPEITGLLAANRLSQAADMIGRGQASYGPGNLLLYYLDRGLVEFYAGRHEQSIASFEKAKQRFKELYTESLSKVALSWAVNDYMLPYRGADHEYVLVNIFQALNFISLGDPQEAQVEARDLSSAYQVIADLAGKMKRQHYEDNGFARMFMGLLYESSPRPEDRSEALLWYKEALALYQAYYGGQYVPRSLAESILPLAEEFSDRDLVRIREELRAFLPASPPGKKGQIVVVQLVGYAPLKTAETVPVPVDGKFIVQFAFPKYVPRSYDIRSAFVTARGPEGRSVFAETELGADIEGLAIRDLESRKAMILAKGMLRPAMKYLIERKQKESVDKKFGRLAGEVFGLVSSLYNMVSEEADVRSWQSLPAQIRLARIFVDPGTYQIELNNLDVRGLSLGAESLGEVRVQAGEIRFIVVRSVR